MSKAKSRLQVARRSQIETLEDRLAMSADPLGGLLSHHGMMDGGANVLQQHAVPVQPPAISHHGMISEDPLFGGISHHTERQADFWLDPISTTIGANTGASEEVEQNLTSAHEQTGLNNVRANYGFRGGGQTVVVIDSGIAYDHYALGGGFGSNYRVVGGWDFTNENDGDPYDDGPEGAHGTHVAGIIGSSHETHTGVAPDVDLIGLRVFDDDGNGYFSWVENALDWVHDNRDAFENPITAVNLSLGTNWNASSIPLWANLESEFAALEADGIFVSVSAGNSFSSYNEPGLSYPAASPYVVPVMSTDDSGYLSHFSQRLDRAIAAPGRFIYSTIPDYAGNNNGVADDFANFSGTSMAAPYVAGASVIVREAMEFVGYTDITQDMIYDHMRATADTVHDSATDLDYLRLNLGAAIDALMPTDDYGSDEASAYDLGTISSGLSTAAVGTMNGVISTLNDSDYFTFTAGATGTVTFTTSNTTHQLSSSWLCIGGEGWSGEGGQSYTMSVVAGQRYTVALSSTGGLGYYDLDITAESTFSYTDWGAIAGQETRTDLTAGAASWYRLEASQYGFLTVEALYDSGTVNLELYDAELSLIDAGDRIDYLAQATEAVFLRVEGDDSNLDLRMTNLVNLSGSTVTVSGTDAGDTFTFAAGDEEHTVAVNGLVYNFSTAAYSTYQFAGAAGEDEIKMTGTAGDESAVLRAGGVDFVGVGFSTYAINIENVDLHGEGGADEAYFYDTSGADTFAAWSDRAVLYGEGYHNDTYAFARTKVYASSGDDIAYLYDTTDADTFAAWKDRAVLYGEGYHNDTYGFARTRAYASSGDDMAYLYDTAGADTYSAWSDRAVMTGDGYHNDARNFARTRAYATDGADHAYFYDATGADTYSAWSDRAVMTGEGFHNDARDFASTRAYSTQGADRAFFYDSQDDDTYSAWEDRAIMYNGEYYNDARGFNRTVAYATEGDDRAYFYDSADDDTYSVWHDRAIMYNGGHYYNDARGFDRTRAYASSGDDRAYFYDTVGDDTYSAWNDRAVMTGDGYHSDVRNFDRTRAYATSGDDRAYLYDTVGDDTYLAWNDRAVMTGDEYHNDVRNFDRTRAYSTTGADRAFFYGAAGEDIFSAWSDRAVMSGNGFHNDAREFATSKAYASEGADRAIFYESNGDDHMHLAADLATVSGEDYSNYASGFARVTASGGKTGADTLQIEVVDFAFDQIGDWDS